MSFHSVAGPRCIVQIFPWEGGIYTLSATGTPGRIISCTVQRDIRESSGNFQIVLAPGGPNGTNAPPTWIDVLTTMSTVQIAMQRGDRKGVVMIGVITEVTETTHFDNSKVERTTTVIGKDIGYFWENFSFFTLASLGLFAAAGISKAQADAFGPGSTELTNFVNALDPALMAGLLEGNPADVADSWYTNIMLNLLSNTLLNNGQANIPFADAVSKFIEIYPNFHIPSGLNYIESEFTFDQKLKSILEWPQYEVWYATLPENYPFTGVNDEADVDFGEVYSVPGIKASSRAWFVGRINPIPMLNGDLSALNTDRWDALPLNAPDAPFISSEMRFSSGEVANVYMLQSNAVRQLIGKHNGKEIASAVFIKMAIDQISLSRFGYRPHWHQTFWAHDTQGKHAQQHGDEFDEMIADMLSRVISWYHPIPLMAHATATFPLMPDVFVGTKFSYDPKKYRTDWTFYVRSVTHEFNFGGPSTTTLQLERGLPTDVYSDHGLLLSIYKGTAQRAAYPRANPFDGDYISNLTDDFGLQLFDTLSDKMKSLLLTISNVYIKPQGDISAVVESGGGP